MNEKALKTLEYDKIIERLTTFATSEAGKQACRSLTPMTELSAIVKAQKETADALSRIYKKGAPSFGHSDIRPSLKRLEIGGTLNLHELLMIASLLTVTQRAREYGVREVEPGSEDSLDEMFNALTPLTTLSRELDRCIVSEEEVADTASPGLLSVRRNMSSVKARVQTQMNSLLNSHRMHLQDAVITMRDGRYCLPVKAEYRGQVLGVIHDQSSTGATLFVEPAAIVKLNNDLKALIAEEQKEIEKVLATLSALVAEQSGILAENRNILVRLDLIFAKGAFAKSIKASEPEFNTKGIIAIKQGRHPLIDPARVVPIDIRLGETFNLLIITGPNTGGKTVSLKTVGLFVLMGQAGLHIPAFEGSKLSVFREVFADIGDEQSIEQSLSTFSAHMTNIAPILEQADTESLVLFDELGAGTDPTEGAALACAILAFLHRMGVRTMATTHYSELKVYALTTEGVENACCEFDVESLRPTYRLLIGIPGKSNAFAISRKLGIPDYIIDDAKTRMTADDVTFETLLADLEHRRLAIEADEAKIAEDKRRIEAARKNIENREANLSEKQDKLLEKSRQEAAKMLADTKAFVDETIRMVNKQTSGSDLAKALEVERTRVRERQNQTDEKGKAAAKPKAVETEKKKPIKLGLSDTVYVRSMNMTGTVATLPNEKGEFYVQMGILRSQVNLSDVELREKAKKEPAGGVRGASGTGKIAMAKSAHVSPELNIIGKTVDECVALMDKYLDDAYLSRLKTVRIVHGRGTGALRSGVHQHLRRLSYVKSFHLGEYGEGDSGVTIVEFKE